MTRHSPQYLISVARHMSDDDVILVGASQIEVWKAAEVARLLWAPGLRVIAAGTYHLGAGSRGAMMKARTYSRDIVAGRQATFTQSRVFDDLRRTRVVFAGALQVDRSGNSNLIGFESRGRFVRGPGSAGLPTLTSHAARFFMALPRHDKESLVERVHRVSVIGDPVTREALGLPAHSLQRVITPLASFAHRSNGLEVIELQTGVTLTDVQEATSFEVTAHPEMREITPITDAEHDALARVEASFDRGN